MKINILVRQTERQTERVRLPLTLSRLLLIGLCGILGFGASNATASPSPASAFQEDESSESKKELDTAEKLSNLRSELKDEVKRLGKEYRAAKEVEGRDKVVQERRAMEVRIVDVAISLIKENEDPKVNLSTITDMIPRVRGEARAKLFDLASEEFGDSKEMVEIVEAAIAGAPTPDDHRFVESVAAKTKNETVKAAATYAQAELAYSVRDLPKDRRSTYVERYGDEFGKYFDQWNTEEGESKLLKLLETSESSFGDMKFRGTKISSLASSMKTKMNLVVGKVVPDIVGEDLDGEPFKLSDYRGKVVMVDFWGDW